MYVFSDTQVGINCSMITWKHKTRGLGFLRWGWDREEGWPVLYPLPSHQWTDALPSGVRSGAWLPLQLVLFGFTKRCRCPTHAADVLNLKMFSVPSDLGYGNLSAFPSPGLINVIELDYWRLKLTKGTHYFQVVLVIKNCFRLKFHKPVFVSFVIQQGW